MLIVELWKEHEFESERWEFWVCKGWIGREVKQSLGEPRTVILLNSNQEFQVGELSIVRLIFMICVMVLCNCCFYYKWSVVNSWMCDHEKELDWWFIVAKPLCAFYFGKEGFGTVLINYGQTFSFWWFNRVYTMFIGCACGYDCLVLFMLWIGHGLVVFACDQRRNSAIFAQAGSSRLSESCRVLFLGLVCVSRLGDQGQSWATWSLAQARDTRPSEVARKPGRFSARLLTQARGFWGFKR